MELWKFLEISRNFLSEIIVPGSGIRAKHLPVVLLLVNFGLFVARIPFHNLPFTFFGIMVSFTYLRFYQVSIYNDVDGCTDVSTFFVVQNCRLTKKGENFGWNE